MLARNSRLVLGGERKLLGLFLQRGLGLLHFAVLGFHFVFLLGEEVGFFLQLGVRFLQLLRQSLTLLEQFLGTHGGGDRIQHNADALRELIEEGQVNIAEVPEGSQFQYGLGFPFKQYGEHHNAGRRTFPKAGSDPYVVLRNFRHQNAALFVAALSDKALTHTELGGDEALIARRIGCKQFERAAVFGGVVDVETAVLRAHQRREFGETAASKQ